MADANFLISIIVKARRELGDVMQKAAAEVDKLTQAEKRRADVSQKTVSSNRVAQKSVQDLAKGYDEYTKKLKAGQADNEVAIKQLDRFSKEFERLAKAAGPAGSEASESLLKLSRDAKTAADEVGGLITAEKKAAADREAIRSKEESDRKKRVDREINLAYKEAAEVERAYEQLEKQRADSAKKAEADDRARALDRRRFWSEIYKAMAEDQRGANDRVTQQIDKTEAADRQRLIDTRIKGEEELAKATTARAAAEQKASAKMTAAVEKEEEAVRKQVQSHRDLRDEIDRSVRAYDEFAQSVRRGDVVGQDARVGLVQHARNLGARAGQASRAFGAASPEALVPGIRQGEASSLIKEISADAEHATPRVSGLAGALQRLFRIDPDKAQQVDEMLESIGGKLEAASYNAVHFAGTLRALVYVGVIVFFGQLVSGAIALAGALTAVASTAIEAGAAVGGALAAGVAQAVPVIGLLGAAWGRVGAVFKAVQQNIKDQNKAGTDQVSVAGQQADAADRLISAQESLTSSQQALTQARADAQRQIEDLIDAEQRAQLQAESAALAQINAQRALSGALRTGDISQLASLSIQARQSNLDRSQAITGLSRATADSAQAQRLGVSGAPGVVAAFQSVEAARRGLANAKRDSQDLNDSVGVASTQLQALLAGLSPTELKLYGVLNRVVKKYREVFTGPGGILDSIIGSFTFGAGRVLSLLDDDRLVAAAKRLAGSISTELRRAFSVLSSQGSRNFLVEISDQARTNLPIVTELAIQFGKIASALAKAGGPALHQLLLFFDGVAGKIGRSFGSDSGLAQLTDFFSKGEVYAEDIAHLAGALLDLFGAIVSDAAGSGDDLIKSITGSIKEATEWIDDHKREVKEFFTDAVRASESIGKAIADLARGLFSLFDADQVVNFSHAFTRTFLPAMIQVIGVVGKVADAFLKFAGTGGGSALGQFALVSFGLNKTLVPLVRLIGQLGLGLGGVLKSRAIVGFFGSLLTKLGPVGLAASVIAAALLVINGRTHFIQKFSDLFVSAQDKARAAADRFTDAINKQIDALKKQRQTGDDLQGSRLSLARSEIALERARADARKVGGIDLSTGRIDSGAKVTLERRDASIAVKQAILDEKQARDDLKKSKDADNKADQDAVTQGKKTLDSARDRVDALQDERKGLVAKRDEAKRNVQADIDIEQDASKSLEERQHAQIRLQDDIPKLQKAQDDLNENTKELRGEAKRSITAWDNYRTAIKRAGKSTDTFGNVVDDTVDGIVKDVNDVLVEFGAKPLKWTSTRKKTSVENESGSDAIFGTPSIGGFPGRQSGGYAVPGHGTGDSVYMQAKVEPGEKVFVLNRMASKAMDGLRWLNSAIPRFAKGGEINWNGHPQDVHQPVKDLLAKVFGRWPDLQVTSTTDHSLRTTSGNISDHSVGNAVDVASSDYGYMNRVAEWIKSSGLYRYLKQGIHNPNLAVNLGKLQDPPGQFAGAVWAQHATHIHLAIAGAIGKLLGGLTSVAGRTIGGPAGRLTDALRGISGRVVRAANSFIRKQTSSSTSDENFAGVPTDGATGNGASLMKRLSKQYGWNFDDWWALDASETSHGANEVNPTSTARLRGQFLSSNYGKYGPGSDPSQHPTMAQQIVAMARYIKARYGDPTKAWAFHLANNFYAKGGEVAGRLGQAVPIVAHAGEWVVNKIQQSKLAQMVGTGVGHLKGALGFSGGGGSYAGGGEVSPYTIPTFPGSAPGDLQRELSKADKVVDKLKSSLINSKFTDALSKTFESIAGDGGLLDLLTQAISDLTTRLDTNLKRATFKVTKSGQVIKRLSDEDVAEKTVENLQRVYGELGKEQVTVQGQLDDVAKRLRSKSLGSGERSYLLAVQKNLTDKLTTIRGAVADNLSATYDAVESAIQTRVDASTSRASARNAVLDLQSRARAISGSAGSAILGLPTPDQIGKARADVLRSQAVDVANAAREAVRAGHADTAAVLYAQVAELQQQAIEAVAQGLRDAETEVDARASRVSGQVSVADRAADLKEKLGDVAGAFALRGQNLQTTRGSILSQIGSYTALLGQAQATGQTAVVEELVDKISDLNESLAENSAAIDENTTAARTAAITAITARQGFLGGVTSGLTSLVNSLGEVSGVTDTGTLRAILSKAGETLAGTGASLLQKLFENFSIDLRGQTPAQIAQSLLGIDYDSVESGMTPGVKAEFEGLINSIIDNTGATTDNTKQLNDLNDPAAQSFSSGLWDTFRRAVFNGASGLLPQFATAVPSLAGPGFVMSGGYTGLSTRTAIGSSSAIGGDTTIINSNITTPTVVRDPIDEARQLAFAYKNRIKR